jgi:hypothetical protein
MATISDIEAQGWSLNPGRYVGVAERAPDDFDFKERLEELNEELEILNAEAHELEERIAENVVRLLEGVITGKNGLRRHDFQSTRRQTKCPGISSFFLYNPMIAPRKARCYGGAFLLWSKAPSQFNSSKSTVLFGKDFLNNHLGSTAFSKN